jgi:protocatechuate 3,4-dioxygenase beta subunit
MAIKRGDQAVDRRLVLRGLGGLGVIAVFDCGGTGSTDAVSTDHGHAGHDSGSTTVSDAVAVEDSLGTSSSSGGSDAAVPTTDGATCILDPTLTKGPYWIDERLDRSDIRSDTNNVANPNPRPGLPLTLRITVLASTAEGCAPLPGAQVDVWHCDATGLYSDTSALGTAGQNFLRGFQTTDASGAVTFTTIYPGWYTGRSVHIHVKVRLFDAANTATSEATTQVFFDDTITDGVCQKAAPYNARGVPDTSNAMDGFYGGHTELLLSLQGDAMTGYTGSITLGVALGTIATG